MTVRVFFFIAYTGGVLKGIHSLTKLLMIHLSLITMESTEAGSRTTLWQPSQWLPWDLTLTTARIYPAQVHMGISQVCNFSCDQLRECLEQITLGSVPRESCCSAKLYSVNIFSFLVFFKQFMCFISKSMDCCTNRLINIVLYGLSKLLSTGMYIGVGYGSFVEGLGCCVGTRSVFCHRLGILCL